MSAEVYPKTAQGARKDNEYALRAEGDNLVIFNDAELYALRNALDEQLDQHKVKGLQRTLTDIVFRRTLPFYKREEDMNSIRLQNLAGSRGDYCYRRVDELVARSILLERRGHYGRILSINFNFSQWDKTPAENGVLVSDPEALLQTLDVQTENDDSDACEPDENPISNTSATLGDHDHATSSLSEGAYGNEALISALHASVQALKDEVSTLKVLLQDVLPSLSAGKNIAVCAEHTTEQPVATPLATLEPCGTDALDTCGNEKPIAEPLVTLESCETHAFVADGVEKVGVEKVTEAPVSTPLATLEDAPVAKPQPEHTGNGAFAAQEDLSFPEELKPHEKTAIAKALEKENIKDKSTCQLLLDDLSSRFKISDWQPIRSPIGYFKSLIRNYQQGTFDDSYVEDFRAKQKAKAEAQSSQQQTQEERTLREKYNNARNQYEQLKFSARELGLSLREMAKRLGWTALLEEMGFDLDAAVPM